MDSSKVRSLFIDFFKSKSHTFVPGSPVAPENDPSLLFVNAGMNQFKDVFLGKGKRSYKRAVNSQVCVRVSGKHNDLEDVGKDTTHLTSFEMLGNWSFGDYYKKEAIVWAWEFLTKVVNLNKNYLYVTVFEEDNEAKELWKQHTNIDPDHIVKCGKKDNFWEMGEVGPCGPCSEIHLDLHVTDPNKCPNNLLTEKELGSDRFIELWNLVFIQFNRTRSGDLEPLPEKHVDTGAGLERLVSVLQGHQSNYETDLIKPIIQKVETISGVTCEDDLSGTPHRVLADHVRTLVFGIADNIIPSNEGQGYVLRRLLRRALRYAKKIGINEPIMYTLVEPTIDALGGHFLHLNERKDYIKTVIRAEEDSFIKTLSEGLIHFEGMKKKLVERKDTTIPGEWAFKLYDTYGFPIDLTVIIAEENKLNVDINAFEIALNNQKNISREATKKKLLQQLNTDTKLPEDYKTAIISEDELNLLHPSEYTDNIPRGGEARVIADSKNRLGMARHHTATHLIHEALRRVLGNHIQQAGSLVDIERLRFDFTHFSSMTKDEINAVEKLVNESIKKNSAINIQHETLAVAKTMGARALFGEKYDEEKVRIVKIGDFSIELCGGTHVKSTGLIEHIKIISETAIAAGTRRIEAMAGNACIKQYESEKIDALIQILETKKDRMQKLINEIKQQGGYKNIPVLSEEKSKSFCELQSLDTYYGDLIKNLEKELEIIKTQTASKEAKRSLDESALIKNDTRIIIQKLVGFDTEMLHIYTDVCVNGDEKKLVIAASEFGGKGLFVVKLSHSTDTSIYHAGEIIKYLTKIAGGGGGGKPQKAQAGGADKDKIDEALIFIRRELSK